MKYLVVIEKANGNYSAYIPDVPGCAATGKIMEEARENIKRAIVMHLAGLAEDGLQAPEPAASADYVTA